MARATGGGGANNMHSLSWGGGTENIPYVFGCLPFVTPPPLTCKSLCKNMARGCGGCK